jgi:hypothetical protein
MDGSHIPYVPTMEDKKYSANRHGWISLNFHAVVDWNMRFTDVNVGCFGSQVRIRFVSLGQCWRYVWTCGCFACVSCSTIRGSCASVIGTAAKSTIVFLLIRSRALLECL